MKSSPYRATALFLVATLAACAAAQNPQGLKGHYVLLSATLVSDTLTPSTTTLTVSGTSSFGGRTWTNSVSATNTTPPNINTSYNGSAQRQTSYKLRVLWVPDADNPPSLVPDGQPAQWTGSESTSVNLYGLFYIPPRGTPSNTVYGDFVAYNHVGLANPSTAISTTLTRLSPTMSKSGDFTDMIDGGFTFSVQPEGWVGQGTFELLNVTNWTTYCGSLEKSWGAGSASQTRTLSKIGGLAVQNL